MTRRERCIGVGRAIACEMALLAAVGAAFAAAGMLLTLAANGFRWAEMLADLVQARRDG